MTTQDLCFTHCDDGSLLDAAKRLATDERRTTAALLRALMEIDSRRLYLGEGCASMFGYCTQVLHLSEGGANNRIEAARTAREYPVILELFEQSAITLTTVRLLRPHLTAENHAAVLTSARHKSKREVEEIVAALSGRPAASTARRCYFSHPLHLASPARRSKATTLREPLHPRRTAAPRRGCGLDTESEG